MSPQSIVRKHRRGGPLLVLLIAGCTSAPQYSVETNYPGSAVGKVEARWNSGSRPKVVNRDGSPATIPVPVGPLVVPITSGLFRTPPSTRYEIRTADGTLLLVDANEEFDVGACVRVSGYADGPSRTQWSLGRSKLESSNNCPSCSTSFDECDL